MHKNSVKYTFILMFFSIFLLVGCGSTKEAEETSSIEDSSLQEEKTSTNYSENIEENPIVTIIMENEKEITIELYPEVAPNTVSNFIDLTEKGFYNGLLFHRVIPNFMIQGGDPVGNGTGGPGYSIEGEFSENGFKNELKHERGVISMARSQSPDSAGSQFFIMVDESPQLDNQYAAFGKVIDGMDVVDSIVSVDRDEKDKPLNDQKIKEIVVDTKGFEYPAPSTK